MNNHPPSSSADPIRRHHELRNDISKLRNSEALRGYTTYDRIDRFESEHGRCPNVRRRAVGRFRRYRCGEHRASLITDGQMEIPRP